ncbi:MAG: amidohydrolase family protein [Lentisphaeria bacterium]|nr:amidohydrolase family protein [Lentisphaeria bacterium]
MTGKLLIENVWLADGTGAPLRKCACLTDDSGRIASIEKGGSACAAETVVAGNGKILAPGFIDAHGHSDISALASPECFSKISQGVTAEICGNCGLSAFPVTPENRSHLEELYANYGKTIAWSSCAGYREAVRNAGALLDLYPLCGHNTLRAAVRGYGEGEASAEEISKMCGLLDEILEQGAPGLSFGLLYTPGVFATPGEIGALMTRVAGAGKICTAHLRSEGDRLLESVSEMIELALEAGLKRFHISHMKTAGKANFHKLAPLLGLIDEARNRGLEISCDRYPYTESMTQLSVILPGAWGKMDDGTLKRTLADPENLLRLAEELRRSRTPEEWERCRIVSCTHPKYRAFQGKKITAAGPDPALTAAEILAFDPVNAQAAFSGMSEENMRRIIQLPYCVGGSDGNALPPDRRFGASHPRAFGALAKFVRLLLDMGSSPENAVRKVTGLTAELFSLPDAGLAAPGRRADMVLFDPDTIDGNADFSAPETPASGIAYVFKNGEIVYSSRS